MGELKSEGRKIEENHKVGTSEAPTLSVARTVG